MTLQTDLVLDGDEKGPWCFTTNPTVKFQQCNVPKCSSLSPTSLPSVAPSRGRAPIKIAGGLSDLERLGHHTHSFFKPINVG